MTKQKLICAGCKKTIDNTFLKAMGQLWHVEHFKCAKCRKTLSTQTFYEKNGLAYCRNDFLEAFCHKCNKCHEYITKSVVNALGKFWHVHCFTCSTCLKPIQPPYFFEKKGKPYCNKDYANKFAPVCNGCGEHIFEDHLEVLGKKLHSACFLCRDCKKPITKKFFSIGNHQICTDCMKVKQNDKQQCYQKCCSY